MDAEDGGDEGVEDEDSEDVDRDQVARHLGAFRRRLPELEDAELFEHRLRNGMLRQLHEGLIRTKFHVVLR